jgi:hypothetical protein
MTATKLRSSSMSLHGVFHKGRVFDPTCLFEAKAKPMKQQKCLFDSNIVNYADVKNLYQRYVIHDIDKKGGCGVHGGTSHPLYWSNR